MGFIDYESWFLNILAYSRSHSYTSVDSTTERFNSKVINSEGGYNSGLDLFTNVFCACFVIQIKFVPLHILKYLHQTKRFFFFLGETPVVKIVLACGMWIWFCCKSCKHRWLKVPYFNTRHFYLYWFLDSIIIMNKCIY